MNNSRRGTSRKNRSVPRENPQKITQFVQRKSKDNFVEIEDDDEVQDLTDQFAFDEDELQPIQVKRKKKILTLEDDSDEDHAELEGLNEDERREVKEALRQSRLELEDQDKRRAAYSTTSAVKLISEVKTGNSRKAEEDETFSDNETQDYLSENIQSSPISSGQERDQQERAESPDLFETPISSIETEELGNTLENTTSPSKSPFKSRTVFSTEDFKKSTLDKDIVINIIPVKSSKHKLKLKKKECSKEQEKEAKIATKLQSEVNKNDSYLESKKRKYCLEDDDEAAGHSSGDEFHVKDTKKKQRTIEQVFNVSDHLKKDEQQMSRTFTPRVVINDDDDDCSDTDDTDARQEYGNMTKRDGFTQKVKKAVKTKLERVYKKPKLSIKTVKDAMKARLYFAPPGIEPKTYTYAIMRMMDHARKRIYWAQKKSLNFIKWGKPVIVGPRELNSLDARKEKEKSIVGEASTSKSATYVLGTASNERKRSLRSAPTISVSPIKAGLTKAREDSRRLTTDYINSDDSDDDLTIPVFGEATTNPKPWKEYLSNEESKTFGENVNTSAEYQDSSFTIDVRPSVVLTEGQQNKIDGKEDECTNEKRNIMNEKLKNTQNVCDLESPLASNSIHDISPTHSKRNLNNEHAGALGNSKDNGSSNEPMMMPSTQVPELDDKDDDDIDSSIEIEMNRSKRCVKKTLFEDEEEEDDSLFKFGIEVTDDVTTGSGQDNAEPARDSKPGASLTNVAKNSGYLKVDRTPLKSAGVQRVMSSATRRAAAAAEKRLQAASVSSSPETSSSIKPSQAVFIPNTEDRRVECPMCFAKFNQQDIEAHASTCDGSNPNPSYFSPSKPTTSSMSQKSFGSPSDSEEQRNKDFGLKNLTVMVTRSPEAHRKLIERKSLSASKAKRNLSLTKASKGVDNKDEESRRTRRYIDMTTDDDDDDDDGDDDDDDDVSHSMREESAQDEKETESQESTPSNNWFSSRISTNLALNNSAQKNKFKVTYGGKKKKNLDPRKNPFTLDFIPLEECPSSSDIENCDTDADNKKGDDDDAKKSAATNRDEKKGVGSRRDAIMGGASTSKTIAEYGEIDSDSDESDMEMLSTYGVKVQSKKRNCKDEDPNERDVNDIRGPQKQENPKKKRKRKDGGLDEDDYENEMALLELQGVPLKRCRTENKAEDISVKRRHRRITSSDESDDNDEYEKCYICFEKVLKEDYKDHTDACLYRKGESFVTPGKGKAVNSNLSISARRSRSRSTTKAGSSEQTIEMDSDEVGDSPIKTFKLIGEDSGSCVDFSNQFSFFKNKGGESKRGARGSGRSRGGKYRTRGRYKRGRGKRKH